MGNNYLLDTNIIIYYFNGIFTKDNIEIDTLFEKSFKISIITKIEFLGWAGFRETDLFNTAKDFIDNAEILYLDDPIAEQTIKIRQMYKIKIPDAIIAATAIVNELGLATSNADDFKSLDLLIRNPFH